MGMYADDIRTIREMHEYKRPAGSNTEWEFVERYLLPLKSFGKMDIDDACNIILRVGDGPYTTMWSSHMDTVHYSDGKQKLVMTETGYLQLAIGETSNCLGADDTAGMWIMIEMIKAGVPGLYVFHYQEESGCVGSRHIANNTPELLKGIRHAIAFDRKGFEDVITHQMGKSASDAFALSFANIVNPFGFKFAPSSNGIFTDTAQYTSIVPECTNISVGYFGAHSSQERLHIPFLIKLKDAMVKFDESKLVVARDVNDCSYAGWGDDDWFGSRYETGYQSYTRTNSGNRYLNQYDKHAKSKNSAINSYYGESGGALVPLHKASGQEIREEEALAVNIDDFVSIEDIVRKYPGDVAYLLRNYGFTPSSLIDEMPEVAETATSLMQGF